MSGQSLAIRPGHYRHDKGKSCVPGLARPSRALSGWAYNESSERTAAVRSLLSLCFGYTF